MALTRTLVLTSLLLSGTAWAGATDDLTAARTALQAGDVGAAKTALKKAQYSLPNSEVVVPAKLVGQYFYYQSMVELLQAGEADDDVMDAFRQTLTVDLEAKWDADISDDGDSRDLFLALGKEVQSWPTNVSQVPEATGAAKLYVDGERVQSADEIRDGTHLAQISCDDGTIQGDWVDFTKKVKWLKMCPNGVDTSVVVAEAEPEDEFAEFGPMFGGDDDMGGDDMGGDAMGTTDNVADVTAGTTPGGTEEQVEIIPAWSRVKWPYVIAGAGAMALGGGLQLGAMNANSSFYDVDNADLTDRASIESARGRVNTTQTLALASLGVGAGLFAVAVIPF